MKHKNVTKLAMAVAVVSLLMGSIVGVEPASAASRGDWAGRLQQTMIAAYEKDPRTAAGAYLTAVLAPYTLSTARGGVSSAEVIETAEIGNFIVGRATSAKAKKATAYCINNVTTQVIGRHRHISGAIESAFNSFELLKYAKGKPASMLKVYRKVLAGLKQPVKAYQNKTIYRQIRTGMEQHCQGIR